MEEVVVAGEVQEVVDFPQVAPPNSTCPPTLVHPCTRGQVSTPCCLQEEWGGLAEGDPPTLGLACPHSSSMAQEATHLTARHYLVVEGQGDPHMAL